MTSLFEQTNMVMVLPLGELRSTSGSPPPIFLSLLDSRIAREETSFFQNVLEFRIKLEKGLRDPVTDRNGLPGNASPLNIHLDVKLISSPGQFQGLEGNHFTGLSPEVFFQSPLVDDKLPLAGFKPNPCNGSLSFAGSINRFCHFLFSFFLRMK